MSTSIAQEHEGRTETDAAFEAGLAAGTPQDVGHDLQAVVVPDGAKVVIIDPAKEAQWRADRPVRKTGKRIVHDAASFGLYVERHAEPGTEVWADLESREIVAHIDGHTAEVPGFEAHKVTLQVKRTKEWTDWLQRSNAGLTDQRTFAEFLEQHAKDVVAPTPLHLIEIAQTITGHRNVQFSGGTRLDNGSISFAWAEDTTAQAGKSGDLTIPETLTLNIRPFVNGPRYEVTAGFRYQVTREGGVRVGIVLISPDLTEEDAFVEQATQVKDALAAEIPLFYGTP